MAGIPKKDLLSNVEAFCAEHGMQDKVSVFQKGALVAQNQEAFEDIEELDEEDKVIIRREKTREFTYDHFENAQLTCSKTNGIFLWHSTSQLAFVLLAQPFSK